MSVTVRDKDWIRQALLLPKGSVDEVAYTQRTYSTDYAKFSDTSLGGNQCINPPYQWGPLTDLPGPRFANSEGRRISFDMGQLYSEVIDDSALILNIQPGITQYNSWTSFFGNYYSADAGRLVRTGRTDGIGYYLGRFVGFVVVAPLIPMIWIGQGIDYLLQNRVTRYCQLKPQSAVYWNAVSNLVNHWAANRGIVDGLGPENFGTEAAKRGMGKEEIEERKRLLPDIYRDDGMIDIYKVATRYQRLAIRQKKALNALRERLASTPEIRDAYVDFIENTGYFDGSDGIRSITEITKAYINSPLGSPRVASSTSTIKTEAADGSIVDTTVNYDADVAESVNDIFNAEGLPDTNWKEYLQAELEDGSRWVSFRVDNIQTMSESVSNSIRDSDAAGLLNSMSSTARNFKHNMMGGNVADIPIVGDLIGAAVGQISGFVSGAIDSIGLGGLLQMAGGAFVDIPKHYDNSSTNVFNSMQFTIPLRAMYNDPIDELQSIWIPAFMLMALAFPRSTGANSYYAPFHVQAFCKGICQTRYGIVTDFNITRGSGNVGWTPGRTPLAVDISMTITDLSTVAHMPMTSNFNPIDILSAGGLSKLLFNDDSTFTDYMATLTGLGLYDQIYAMRKMKLNFYRNVLNWESWLSPAQLGNYFGGSVPAGLISAIYNGTARE